MSARTVSAAVVSSLSAHLPDAVFPAHGVPSPAPKRYAVVWAVVSGRPRTRFSGGQWGEVVTVTVHCVGPKADDAMWVQERVDRLTDVVLIVPGRLCHPTEFVTGQPPSLIDEVPTPLIFAVSQFDVYSEPA